MNDWRSIDPQKVEEIRAAWRAGRKRSEIAKAFSVSNNTVLRYCRDIPKPVEHRGRPKRNET
jgi:DNA invertase Pin-like site-specific DNA recombinase